MDGLAVNSQLVLVRHEADVANERSLCGKRYRLISEGDEDVAAWVHAVDVETTRPHFHKRSTEIYYILEGQGTIFLDGEPHSVFKGSAVHIPPGVVHRAKGKMRLLVVGIPDIADDDVYHPEQNSM